MITKVKFGARGQFTRLEAEKRREVKTREKISQMAVARQRKQFKIGPINGEAIHGCGWLMT